MKEWKFCIFAACHPIEIRIISAEEMAAWEEFTNYVNLSYGDYDFNYDIHNELEAAKLEEIAAKYGLHLRQKSTLLWSRETIAESEAEMNAKNGTDFHTDTSDPRFLSNWELCERVADAACHGPLFRETPRGFDKVYYYDEGTFCVSYDQQLIDGRRVRCYGYNSISFGADGIEERDMAFATFEIDGVNYTLMDMYASEDSFDTLAQMAKEIIETAKR